jgi:hypothetical protein
MLVYDTNILLETQGDPYNNPPLAFNYMSARVGFRLKALLKSVGWVHQASGDGLAAFSMTPGNVNDVITTETAGANGMNPAAWFVLQQPGSARQLCFQIQDPALQQWRLKYSISAGFTGGTPGAFIAARATDEVFVLGGGADEAPSYDAWLTYNGGQLHATYCHMAADNAAPYGFWVTGYPVHGDDYGAYPQFIGMLDPVTPANPGDPDPYVFYFTKNQGGTALEDEPFQLYSYAQGAIQGYVDYGGPNQAWSPFVAPRVSPQTTGVGPFSFANNRIDRFPVVYMLETDWTTNNVYGETPSGYKGRSSFLAWCSQEFLGGQTLQVSTPRDTIVFGWMTLPWNGTLPRV